ncbi:hypothetical protein F4604DRAFT_1862351, partial [Suillus subluteus]
MGSEKSWLWDHFHQGTAKVDKVHWQARCKYCVNVKAKDLANRVTDRSLSLAEDEDESHPVTSIIDSIEKRWKRADQDLFIIALFLNPLINPNVINSRVLPPGVLMELPDGYILDA